MKISKKNFVQHAIMVVLLASIAYLGYLAAIRWIHKEARIKIPISVWNFGPVEPGSRLRYSFMLQNIGTAPLIIDKVTTSCGCMDTALSENIILPGHISNLQVELKAAKYRKPINETILLSTNDKSKPQIALKLKANVVTMLDISPSALNFGVLTKEELPCSKSVRISYNKNMVNYKSCEDYKWQVSSTEPMFLKSKIQPDPNDIDSLIVTATLSENVIPGPINGVIKISAPGNNNEIISREITIPKK